MGLDFSRLNLIRIHLVAIEQIDGLGDHFHVAQLFSRNIHEQIFDLRVFDPEALRHILHGRFQFAVATAQLLL